MKRLLSVLFAIALPIQSQPPLNCGGAGCVIKKTPYEQFDCSMDFAQPIGTDAMTLDSVSSSIGGNDTTSQVIAASPAPSVVAGTKVVFRVAHGTNGQLHTISVKVVDSTTGETYEGLLQLRIE